MNRYLIHYNHNHDKLGRFARSGSGGVSRRTKKKIDRDASITTRDPNNYSKVNKHKTERSKIQTQINKEAANNDARREIFEKYTKKSDPYYDAILDIRKDVYSRRDLEMDHKIDEFVKKNGHATEEDVARIEQQVYPKYNEELSKKTEPYTKQLKSITNEAKREHAQNYYNTGQKYTEQYIDATIKDLRLKNDQETRDYIRSRYNDTWFMEGADEDYKKYLK